MKKALNVLKNLGSSRRRPDYQIIEDGIKAIDSKYIGEDKPNKELYEQLVKLKTKNSAFMVIVVPTIIVVLFSAYTFYSNYVFGQYSILYSPYHTVASILLHSILPAPIVYLIISLCILWALLKISCVNTIIRDYEIAIITDRLNSRQYLIIDKNKIYH